MLSYCGPQNQRFPLYSSIIEVLFQLRNTPSGYTEQGLPLGVSVEDVQSQPELSSYTSTDIANALVVGAKKGIWSRCMYPDQSQIYYYAFNRNMIQRNFSNKVFALAGIAFNTPSGSGGPSGGNNVPLGAELNSNGVQLSNNLACCNSTSLV